MGELRAQRPRGAEVASGRRPIATVNRLLAVLDTPEAATAAIRALGRAGFPSEAVTALRGDADADRIDSRGFVRGRWRRAWRILQFTQTDQMVDLAVYEAALRDGRTVVLVHARRPEDRDRAQRALEAAGAHFMNFFGRIATEDIARWRGEELPIPKHLLR
jgi:hypothetical protein